MFIGHAAAGLAAQRWAPKTPFALLLAAPFLADLLWPVFLLLGWEHVRIDPGNTAVTPLDFVSYPWSHSLLLALGWSALFGGLYALSTRDRRGAAVLGLLVASHWVLDWASHRPDLPLLPIGGPKVGLGLWYSMPATVVVEGGLFASGLGLYLWATRAKSWAGHLSLWSLVALLVSAYWANLTSPPPPTERAVALATLALFLFVPWGWWIGRTRAVVERPARG